MLCFRVRLDMGLRRWSIRLEVVYGCGCGRGTPSGHRHGWKLKPQQKISTAHGMMVSIAAWTDRLTNGIRAWHWPQDIWRRTWAAVSVAWRSFPLSADENIKVIKSSIYYMMTGYYIGFQFLKTLNNYLFLISLITHSFEKEKGKQHIFGFCLYISISKWA